MKTDISFYIFTSHKKKGSSYMLKAVQKVKGKGFIDHLYLFICFNTKEDKKGNNSLERQLAYVAITYAKQRLEEPLFGGLMDKL